MFEPLFTKSFDKIYRKLNKDLKTRIDKTIEKICKNPEIGKPLRYYPSVRSEKIGVFRLVYLVRDKKIISLVLGHRKHVYKNLDRYFASILFI